MVDYSHLSAGNSSDSSSRNLFSEFGVSNPNVAPAEANGNAEVSNLPCENMAESSPVPQAISVSSDDSISGPIAGFSLMGNVNSELQDIFKAAHHFANQDRIDVVAERAKNQNLLAFLAAQGLTIKDFNAFVSNGAVSRSVDEHNLFVKSPSEHGGPSHSPAASAGLSSDLPERGARLPSPNQPHSRLQSSLAVISSSGIASDAPLVLQTNESISGKDIGEGTSHLSPLLKVSEARDNLSPQVKATAQSDVIAISGMESESLQGLPAKDPICGQNPGAGILFYPKLFQNSDSREAPLPQVAISVKTSSTAAQVSNLGASLPSDPISAHVPIVGETPGNKSWSSLLTQTSPPTLKLSFFPPSAPSSSLSGPIIIQPPMDVLKKGTSIWNSSLIGHFLHSRLPYKVVEPAAMRMWGNYGLQKVLLHEKGYYIFKFKEHNDRDNVLALGPWYIANRLIKLQHWKENANLSQEICTKTPVWVKLHHLPFSYWTEEGLSYVASGLGKPLFTDKTTAKLDPMPFARLCIEMNAESTFPDSLSVAVHNDYSNSLDFVEVKVEYQNRPASCPSCHTFDHSKFKCPKANFQWIPKSSTALHPISASPAPILASPSVGIPAPDHLVHPHGNSQPLDGEWKTVSKCVNAKDKRKSPAEAVTPISNSFLPIGTSDFSDTDITPSPNPLVSKLILIDEKEGKELKKKGKASNGSAHVSKRNRQGGGIPSII